MSSNGNLKFSIGRLISILFMVTIVIVGGTYAWFTYQSKQSALVLSIGDLKDSKVTLTPYQIKETMTPVATYTSGVYSQVEAVNNSSNDMLVTLLYNINELDESLVNNGLKYTVTSSSSSNGTYTEVVTGDFTTSVGETETVVLDTKIDSSTTVYYRVYLWLDSNYGNQSVIQNASLDLQLNADLDQEPIAPVLDVGMVPVTISNDGTVTTISSSDNDWYNYRNQEWANVVLVTEPSRSSYLGTTGKTVSSSDILAYYVWIPRYRYRIWTTGVSATGKEQEIEILFETSDSSRILGTGVDQYRTHPAFWWDNDSDGTYDENELLPGIWVGKFETTGDVTTPTILPNVSSLRSQNVSAQFATSLRFASGRLLNSYVGFIGNAKYGLTNATDSHMAKNVDWGSVAYLSHSKYGINEEIRINNNSRYTTGCGASSVNGGSSSTCQIAYGAASSYPQSTTGNITGIFDMSGGVMEHVMGNYNNTIGDSGFTTLPDNKYYDLYLSSQFTGNSNTNMSLCTLDSCGGHALNETSSWYNDSSLFISASVSWIHRGYFFANGGSTGLFASSNSTGEVSTNTGFRSVLVPLSEELQDTTLPIGTITSTNNLASSQTATLTMSDNSAVAAYYFGTSNPSTTTVTWTSMDYTPSTTVSKTVTGAGTYYLGVRDSYGNESVVSKVFYKTTLSISNGSVSPTSVITMSGNKFTLPSPVLSDGYKFDGWYTSSSYSGSPITTYTPTSNTTLYGKTSLSTVFIDAPTASYCKTLTYTGASQTLTNTAGEGYAFSGNTGTNAGDYTVTAKLSSGYAWSDGTSTDKTFTCSIGKKSVAVTWGTTTSFAYNGSPQSPTASVSTGITGETMAIVRTFGTNAGSYTCYASCSSVTGGQATCDNYTLTGRTKAFTITKVTPTITLSATSGTSVYGTASKTFTVSSSHGGTLSVSDNNSTASSSISGTTVTIGSLGSIAVGTKITVTVTSAATTNYNAASATYTLTINDPAPTVSSVSASKSGSVITATVTASDQGTGISNYYYVLTTATTCPSSGYTSSSNKSYSFTPSSAGTYYVCAYVSDGSGNTSSKVRSSAVTLTSGSGSVSASNITLETYRGNASQAFSVYQSRLTLGDTIYSVILGIDSTDRYHVAQLTFKPSHDASSLTLKYVAGKAVTYVYPLYYKVLAAANTNYYYNYPTGSYWNSYDGTWTPSQNAWTWNTVSSIKPPSGSATFKANTTYYMYIWGGLYASQYIRFSGNTADYPLTISYDYLS